MYEPKPLDLRTLDALILRAEGYVLELKALRADMEKLSAESRHVIHQFMLRAQR